MKIIDPHVHLWPKEKRVKLLKWYKLIEPDDPIDTDISFEQMIEDLAGVGVEKVINLVFSLSPEETESLNKFNADLGRKFKQLYPVASIHQHDKNKKDILKKAFFDQGLMGLKLHSFIQRIDIVDPEMEDVWKYCEKWGRPIFIHTGYDDIYKNKLTPSSVRTILERHPELHLVTCHTFYPDIHEGIAIAKDFPGVYIDLTGISGSIGRLPSGNPSAEKIKKSVHNAISTFPDRIFCGTDYPACGAPVENHIPYLKALNINEEDLIKILYTNAARFIGKFKMN